MPEDYGKFDNIVGTNSNLWYVKKDGGPNKPDYDNTMNNIQEALNGINSSDKFKKKGINLNIGELLVQLSVLDKDKKNCICDVDKDGQIDKEDIDIAAEKLFEIAEKNPGLFEIEDENIGAPDGLSSTSKKPSGNNHMRLYSRVKFGENCDKPKHAGGGMGDFKNDDTKSISKMVDDQNKQSEKNGKNFIKEFNKHNKTKKKSVEESQEKNEDKIYALEKDIIKEKEDLKNLGIDDYTNPPQDALKDPNKKKLIDKLRRDEHTIDANFEPVKGPNIEKKRGEALIAYNKQKEQARITANEEHLKMIEKSNPKKTDDNDQVKKIYKEQIDNFVKKMEAPTFSDSEQLFSTKDYNLTQKGKENLDKYFDDNISKILKSPKLYEAIDRVIVEGYADSRSYSGGNKQLSELRANTVKEYFLSKVSEEDRPKLDKILLVEGKGAENPILKEDNKTEDYEKSRRVEIKVKLKS